MNRKRIGENNDTMFEFLAGYNETPMTGLAMQLPMLRYASAYALDLNGDGKLDLYSHNHNRFTKAKKRWADPSMKALGPKPGGCFVDFDVVLFNETDSTYYAPNDGKGFIEWSDAKPNKCFDSHSSAFLDINGDGILDYYLVTGGGFGSGNSSQFDNAIFWGEKDPSSELGYRLVGGKDAALKAGLHGRDGGGGSQRGRHQYWFDADGDGRLDVVTLSDERKDLSITPGRFHKNENGRKFKTQGIGGTRFAEYGKMALLTDMDGDGFAKELLVVSNCRGSSKSVVCKGRPRNSLGVYQFDSGKGELLRSTLSQKPSSGVSKDELALTTATGDVDFDGTPDIAILWSKRIHFYLSSTRKTRCKDIANARARQKCMLQLGQPNSSLDTTPLCGTKGATGIRFADFNLDGRIDMLVVCFTPGRHGIYELVRSKNWRLMRTSQGKTMTYGALNSRTNMLGGDVCKGVPTTNAEVGWKNSECTKFFSAERCKVIQYKLQFAVCSRQKQNLVSALNPTVADIDNDGYVDILLGYSSGSVVIMRNTLGDTGKKKRFLAVSVDKKAGPAASIGAIVELISAKMGPSENKKYRQLRVVSSLNHQTDPEGAAEDRIIFGLGSAGIPKRLTVRWPHCCKPTIVYTRQLTRWMNSMDSPYEVRPPPANCDKSCFK